MSESARDELLENLSSMVDEYGWAGMAIFDPEEGGDRPWFYTAGLTAFGHPELVIYGLPPQIAHMVIAGVVDRIKEGHVVVPDTYDDQVLEGYPVAWVTVDEPRDPLYSLNIAQTFFGDDVQALQAVWPDPEGRFPWDGGDPRQRLFGTWGGPDRE